MERQTTTFKNKQVRCGTMNVSNSITIGRILLSPLVAWLVYTAQWPLAIGLFILVALSDVIDGYIARKRNEVDALGAFLDPLADKVFVILIFAALTFQLDLPWWYWSIAARDILVTGGALYGLAARVPWNFTASAGGKLVTFLQVVTVSVIIVQAVIGTTFGMFLPILLPILIMVTAISGVVVAIHYLFKAKVSLPQNRKKKRVIKIRRKRPTLG